jgi:ABC-type transport system involved in multi-copper enzyme maturation permease subunit
MLLGPLFRVEMVATARRTRYYLLRALYGVLVLAFLWIAAADELYRSRGGATIGQMAALAESFFESFAWIQLGAVLLVGPALVAGSISAERLRRTIEHLFVSDLSNAEIVLGKLAARLLSIGSLVLVGLPILAIFRLLGGIPGDRLAAVFLITASTMLLVCTVSICISVWTVRPRDAIVRAYFVLSGISHLELPGTVPGSECRPF